MTQEIARTDSGVLTISFNRLERNNAITGAMYGAIAAALLSTADDNPVRVAVLEGHESAFTAGNDLGDFLKASGDADQLFQRPERQGVIRRSRQYINVPHRPTRSNTP